MKSGKIGNPNWQTGQSANPATQWAPGQSGNPAGKPKARVRFDRALADALAGGDDAVARADELAALLWKSARAGEAWAVQLLFARLAPQPLEVRMGSEPDVRQAVMDALADLPDEVRYTVARKLFDAERLMETEAAGNGAPQ